MGNICSKIKSCQYCGTILYKETSICESCLYYRNLISYDDIKVKKYEFKVQENDIEKFVEGYL